MKLLPVIHVADEAQAVEQARVAASADVDGIWLINHGIGAVDLWHIFTVVRRHNPDMWIGLNFLDLSPLEAMRQMTHLVDGLWVDDGGVTDKHVSPQAEDVWRLKHDRGWEGQLFGGIAFKGQLEVQDWALAAGSAVPLMDVVTTSGPATGIAASLDKIRSMSTKAPRLGVASGITVENVLQYLPWATYFLVATGISRDFHHLDPGKTADLARIIHRFRDLAEERDDSVLMVLGDPQDPEGV